jgi:hypothetical protein
VSADFMTSAILVGFLAPVAILDGGLFLAPMLSENFLAPVLLVRSVDAIVMIANIALLLLPGQTVFNCYGAPPAPPQPAARADRLDS